MLRFSVGEGLFAVGVKLRKAAVPGGASLNPVNMVKSYLAEASGGPPDVAAYTADRATVATILGRAGGRVPTPAEMRRLELWWKGGGHARPDRLEAMPDGAQPRQRLLAVRQS